MRWPRGLPAPRAEPETSKQHDTRPAGPQALASSKFLGSASGLFLQLDERCRAIIRDPVFTPAGRVLTSYTSFPFPDAEATHAACSAVNVTDMLKLNP